MDRNDTITQIKTYASRPRLCNIGTGLEAVLHRAQQDRPGYTEFLLEILQKEIDAKREKDFARRPPHWMTRSSRPRCSTVFSTVAR